jgi:2-polyprenyl-6-methoxyphenol hydroxylase-like FAD-dependent oxidoreductase
MSCIAQSLNIAVVGASLGGLSAATVLHRLGANVSVLECFGAGFHTRGGALGAVDVDLVRDIRGDTDGQGHKRIRGHGHFYGDLWQYLFEGLPEATVQFDVDVDGIVDPDTDQPGIRINGDIQRFDLIIGADGGKSTIRKYVTQQTPAYAGYTSWRGLCPTEGIDGPPSGSSEFGGCYYETLGFPCAGPEGSGTLWNCGVYMAMPENEVETPTRNRQVKSGMREMPDWFVPFVRKFFGNRNAKFWDECSKAGKVSPHAVWELACDKVVNSRIVLLGDAAHMASPRTGAGAYTAMTDAVILREALRRVPNLDQALQLYNENTVERGHKLYQRSRNAARSFAPRGVVPASPRLLTESNAVETASIYV